jgi:hypothetical protein
VHLRDFFKLVVQDDALMNLDVVVAWIKRTGVNALRPSIDEFRARGGAFRAIAGISQGGTSKQGLTLLNDLADEAFVFHHPGRTFHPKVYVASGSGRGLVFVGSHNFTLGGATRNYEAAILSELDLTQPEDRAFFDDVEAYIARLIDDTDLCIPLDGALIEELDSNPRYRLSDEDMQSGTDEPGEGLPPPDSDADPGAPTDEESAALFGHSKHAMRVGPPSAKNAAPTVPRPAGTPRKGSGAGPDPVVKRWFKRLPATDAQQLSGSNPSNTMTLVRAGHAIDAAAYFRTEFFASETWATSETIGGGQPREIATIEADVIVRSTFLGTRDFEIRHTPGYDSNQANRTTEFAWGDFGDYLRTNPVTGMIATLEKTAAGRYRLVIDQAATGGFLY